jgi:hypothetical protein
LKTTINQITQGEWTRDNTRKYYKADVIRHNGQLVAEICHTITHSEEELNANARLISSAPDLLWACEFALDVLLINGDKDNAIHWLKKALAKAEATP